MKILSLTAIVGLVAYLAGCTSTPQPPLALAPIGPRQLQREPNPGPRGSLIVYSAFEYASSNSDSDQRRHTDYELRSADGALTQRISNRADTMGEEPAILKLTPGNYSITARAKSAKQVIVPLVIETDKTTCVRLDGSEPIGSQRVAASEMVRLPDGTPVGWRAKSDD